jgi:5'-nucleotidase
MKLLKDVFIKNRDLLKEKLDLIKKDGINHLHVVSDFDKTLNKEYTKTGKFKSAISLIRDGGYLEDNYPQKSYALYDKYHLIEIDILIPFEEKKEKMKEWWEKHIKLISESKMNKNIVLEIIIKSNMELRERVDIFLKFLFDKKIPLLIFSSGIGDFIISVLNKENLLFSNIEIVSNFFDWDQNGYAKPNYKDKIIHIFNKNEFELKNNPYYNQIKERKNVIVIGDSLEDVKMVDGLNNKVILSIGFLNSDIEHKLEIYKNTFDIVIVNDGSFLQVIDLLKEIINGEYL